MSQHLSFQSFKAARWGPFKKNKNKNDNLDSRVQTTLLACSLLPAVEGGQLDFVRQNFGSREAINNLQGKKTDLIIITDSPTREPLAIFIPCVHAVAFGCHGQLSTKTTWVEFFFKV